MRTLIPFVLAITAMLRSPCGWAAVVTSTADNGPDSLRQAIADASPGETLTFAVSGPITLTSGELLITNNLTIMGPGASQLTVQRSTAAGTPDFRIFDIRSGRSGTVTISGLTVNNGRSDFGGGILNQAGADLRMHDLVITGNAATNAGGGIMNLGTLTLDRSIISGNSAGSGPASRSGGGGFYNDSDMIVSNSRIDNNLAVGGANADGIGGGINNRATATLINCTVSSNMAVGSSAGGDGTGGGINNDGTVTLTNCTVSANSASGGAGSTGGGARGAGIANDGGTVNLDKCTVSGNSATGGTSTAGAGGSSDGGGIANEFGTVTLENSTVSGNAATPGAGTPAADAVASGGLFNFGGTTTLNHSTVTANTAADGSLQTNCAVFNSVGSLELKNTIVAGNTASFDLFSVESDAVASGGFNLIGRTNVLFVMIPPGPMDRFNVTGAELKLGPLQDNGGVTFTHALLCGSPAIDAGDNTDAPEFDQRDTPFLRIFPTNGVIDIGAYEYSNSPPTVVLCPTNMVVKLATGSTGTNLTLVVQVADADGDEIAVVWSVEGQSIQQTNRVAVAPSIPANASFTRFFEIGTNTVLLRVLDTNLLAFGNTESCEARCTTTVTVTANTPPLATNQSVKLEEDNSAAIVLTGSDADADRLTFAIVNSPTNGVISGFNPNTGALTYTPNTNFNGADSFTFKVNDGAVDSGIATVSITVTEVNDAPTATADSKTTAEDTALSFAAGDLTANDSAGPPNESGQTLTVTAVGNASHGTVTLVNGTITYTPAADYNGPDSFTYTVTDNGTTDGSADPKSATGTVNVTVSEVNDAPTATTDSKTTAEDTALSFTAGDLTANDSAGPPNESGQTLTVTAVGNASHGTVTLVNGIITYTPAADYNGPDSFTYTVTDNGTTDGSADPKSATGTVNVTVSEVNDAPTATTDSKTTAEDTASSFAASDLTANDSAGPPNESGQTLTVTAVGNASHGTVTLVNGIITYTPAADYNGPDSFTYTVTDNGTTDGSADPKSATGTVNVTVAEVNDAPTAATDSKTTAEDTASSFAAGDLTANDSAGPPSESGQTLTVTAVGNASHGTVTLVNGIITYTPAADYNGPDSFTYTVTDNGTTDGSADPKSATGTVNVTVGEVNDAPTATTDSKTTAEDTASSFAAGDLTANDSAGPPSESGQTLTVTAVGTASHGTVTLVNGIITYTPATDYNGPDSFTYTVTDNGTTDGSADPKSATGTVNVTVGEVNDAPTANTDSKTTAEDTASSFAASDLTANDSAGPPNESGQTLTVTAVGNASHGTVTLVNGIITYTPAPDYNGPDSFTYTVTDNGTTAGSADPKSATSTVSVTVGAVNDAPVAVNDEYKLLRNTTLTVPVSGVLTNDSDPDVNTTLTAVLVSGPTNAVAFILNPDGSFSYTPATNYIGPDSFTYRASDGLTNSAPVTVSLAVVTTNTAPVALPDSYDVVENAALAVPAVSGVLTNDSDADGDALTAVLTSGPAHAAAFTLNPDGSFSYEPAPDYVGPDSFTYQAHDGLTNSAPVTVSLTVRQAPTQGCDLYPIALHQQSLAGVAVGAVIRDIYNGIQPGNFGWLTWAGSPSEPTLATSLTPPGNSGTYSNPNAPSDHVVSVGDWVQGSPGVSNSRQVREELEALKQIDITVPVWDQASGTGNNSLYRVAAFARVRIVSYQLPRQNRISAQFLGLVNCE